MRLIKLAIISAVVLFTVIFLMSLLIPSHVRISRAVNINADMKFVVGRAGNMAGWAQWNELVKNGGPLEFYPLEKKLQGEKLEIIITRTTPDSVFSVWRNQHGKEIAGVFSFQQAGNVTIVQYYYDFYQRWYPWEKFASINLDKQWGPAMEKSLDNLKLMFNQAQ